MTEFFALCGSIALCGGKKGVLHIVNQMRFRGIGVQFRGMSECPNGIA